MRGHICERSAGHSAILLDVRETETGKRKRRWRSSWAQNVKHSSCRIDGSRCEVPNEQIQARADRLQLHRLQR
jgi:hypothetical protein